MSHLIHVADVDGRKGDLLQRGHGCLDGCHSCGIQILQKRLNCIIGSKPIPARYNFVQETLYFALKFVQCPLSKHSVKEWKIKNKLFLAMMISLAYLESKSISSRSDQVEVMWL